MPLDRDADDTQREAMAREALGERIRSYRTMRHLSARELARRIETSVSFVSQLERGQTSASLAVLRRIASALGLALAELFDETPPVAHRIVRKADRPELEMEPRTRKFLLSQRPIRHLEVYIGEFEAHSDSGEPYTHGDSQELFVVTRGSVNLWLAGAEFSMAEGDSIEYQTSVPHHVVNASDDLAEVMWIISPPSPTGEDAELKH